MHWVYLFFAGLFEVAWAVALKYTEGFTKPIPIVITAVTMGLSIYLLSIALKSIPLGTGYVIWTGIGAVGTSIVGILLFEESKDILRLFFLFLIIVGMVGLKFTSKF